MMNSQLHPPLNSHLNQTPVPPPVMNQQQYSSAGSSKPIDSPPRGRPLSRDNDTGEDGQEPGQPARKRRRSRKAGDKKFDCTFQDCGKSYSRAEHLYRHQLNHSPKQIYACDFPDCDRKFVRQDLCARHKERHTARGSQLQRKEVFMHNINTMGGKPSGKPDKDLQESPVSVTPSSATFGKAGEGHFVSPPAQKKTLGNHTPANSTPSISNADLRGQMQQTNGDLNSTARMKRERSSTENSYHGYDLESSRTMSMGSNDRRQGSYPNPQSQVYGRQTSHTPHAPPQMHNISLSSPYTPQHPQQYSQQQMQQHHQQQQQDNPGYMHHTELTPFSLPPPGFQTMTQTTSGIRDGSLHSVAAGRGSIDPQTMGLVSTVGQDSVDAQMTDGMHTMQVFGGEGYSRSPFAMAEDFAAWLFNETQMGNFSPMTQQPSAVGFNDPTLRFGQNVYSVNEFSGPQHFPHMLPQQTAMPISNMLQANMPESQLSVDKRQSILDLIEERFNEPLNRQNPKGRDHFWEGDRDDENHVLSLRMMQTYISSYWMHFHAQMPILHKPTFVAGKTPDLLLIMIIAIGAACLDRVHGHTKTQQAAEFANFLVWHVRWEMFRDADFRPPAKLWIFQALLLLETYEKMYATRALHERAHIHHATTITLMRRGSSLTGKPALDSPPSVRDDKGASTNGSTPSGATSQEEWWRSWVAAESTRRAAFAAFVLDSAHATMFGHSAVMVAHEMRLPLPCDEALWSAPSSSEVYRLEQTLHANGVKSVTFLEGLKKTLGGQPVRTNSFGRTVLMAGLLSVSWHMNQRDLQVSSLGVSSALGGKDKWRGSLTRAFDHWREDFDRSLGTSGSGATIYDPRHYPQTPSEENIFESRYVLHNLAHMAMHVDIVDLQIYAGASRLLGRAIAPQDYAASQRRMKEWVPTARARDAVFYALQFLAQVLIPASGQNIQLYSAREDFLLNRPWVLYYAALIIFSYGFTIEGAITPPYTHPSSVSSSLAREDDEDKYVAMRAYLTRMSQIVRGPDDLNNASGRNRCAGVLLVLCELFKRTRWELLHEAANLLDVCVTKLRGRSAR